MLDTERIRTRIGTWNRPMLGFAAVMAALTVWCLVAMVFDHREVLGANVWAKPLKFALSFVLYATTWAWLVSTLSGRNRRFAEVLSAILVTSSSIEVAAITAQAARGVRSHFNISTPLDALAWATMGISIVVLWVATLLVTLLLWRTRFGDRALTHAARAGAVIGLVGMGIAALMTMPWSLQLTGGTFDPAGGTIGSHAVGGLDGGAGLPLLGWSTEFGDLRVAHFIGMHALQVLPLLALGLEYAGLRRRRLAVERTRTRLVAVATAAYAGVVLIVTAQALRGQSVVAPDRWTLLFVGVLAVGCLVALVWALRSTPTESTSTKNPDLEGILR